MTKIKLTIELSEQALGDFLDVFEVGVNSLNPEYYRKKHIDRMYERILEADSNNKSKIRFEYENNSTNPQANHPKNNPENQPVQHQANNPVKHYLDRITHNNNSTIIQEKSK